MPLHYSSKKSIKGVWNNISNIWSDIRILGINLNVIITWNITLDNNTLFWIDGLVGSENLKSCYPNLYIEIEKNNVCVVSNHDRITPGVYIWA